jgi:vacuolar-type H+-ATPase subunit I/STV1
MIPASQILKEREELIQKEMKENIEKINKEMLEFEKVMNVYRKDTKDKKKYVEVPLIIKTEEVKKSLADNGYIIYRVSSLI